MDREIVNAPVEGGQAGARAEAPTEKTVLIESVLDNKKNRIVVRRNVLEGKIKYVGVYGGRLGAESDDVIYIFNKCYTTLYVNGRVIKTPKWALDLCTAVKKRCQKKKKE
ncbi:MAG: hypothetical protein QW680_11180 [Pyrobaculum sp.]